MTCDDKERAMILNDGTYLFSLKHPVLLKGDPNSHLTKARFLEAHHQLQISKLEAV